MALKWLYRFSYLTASSRGRAGARRGRSAAGFGRRGQASTALAPRPAREWGDAVEFFCGDSGRANRADDPLITPTRVFDNLYAIGGTSTVVWAVTTPDGILLIDAGYPDQLESVLLPGLRAAGLDPNDVRYVLSRTGTPITSAARRISSSAARASRCRPPIGISSSTRPAAARRTRPRRPACRRRGATSWLPTASRSCSAASRSRRC